jgi:hypothetical protein
MLLRKKKSKGEVLAERAGEFWENASQSVVEAADSVAAAVGPRLEDARVAAGPVLVDAQERAAEATELSRRKAKKARRCAKKTVTVSAEDYVTMAEEPIEVRLRRAWLNGFKDGVDRASYAATESTGRWDY